MCISLPCYFNRICVYHYLVILTGNFLNLVQFHRVKWENCAKNLTSFLLKQQGSFIYPNIWDMRWHPGWLIYGWMDGMMPHMGCPIMHMEQNIL